MLRILYEVMASSSCLATILVQLVKAITLLRHVYLPRHYAQIILAGSIHDKAHD